MSFLEQSGRRRPYPEIEPFRTGRLQVDPVHEIYFEESGNPDGKPVLFVHGGPGGGTEPGQRRFWDPASYRIVLFDQRGCGRSTPHAELERNTTWHLVEDMEALRGHLGIEAWQLFGGSWGSTLSLAYAQRHPSRVTELILRGIFLLRKRELDWYYQEGASRIFPDAWAQFVAPIPTEERGNLLEAYYRRLSNRDEEERRAFARAWSTWEGATSRLLVDEAFVRKAAEPRFADAFARIESHYFVHGGFLDSDGALLKDVEAIRHIPAVIVHGRYDVVCPIESAWDLHQAWPEAELVVVPDAGHSAFEPGILSALVDATDGFR